MNLEVKSVESIVSVDYYIHWNGIFGRFYFLEQCGRRRFEKWELTAQQHVENNAQRPHIRWLALVRFATENVR